MGRIEVPRMIRSAIELNRFILMARVFGVISQGIRSCRLGADTSELSGPATQGTPLYGSTSLGARMVRSRDSDPSST